MSNTENWRRSIVAGNRLWAIIDGKAEIVDVMRVSQDNSVTIIRAYTEQDAPRVILKHELFISQHDALDELRHQKRAQPGLGADRLIIDDNKTPR